MPPITPKTRMDVGDNDPQHAPNHIAIRAPKRGISDAALRTAKPKDKPYKLAAGNGGAL